METQEFWISKGRLEAWPDSELTNLADERKLLSRDGAVLVRVSADGIVVKWDANAPNWASLFFAREWIEIFEGPYTLNYFLTGWFSETFADATEAITRIGHLIANADIRLRTRVFVQSFDKIKPNVLEPLQEVYENNRAGEDVSVDCFYDQQLNQFRVTRIGAASAIARFWGQSASTYPCLNGGAYDRIVSSIYSTVVETRRPHYDQVYAAMERPDGETGWIPYHRVIVPKTKATGESGVSVVSVFKPVDIVVV